MKKWLIVSWLIIVICIEAYYLPKIGTDRGALVGLSAATKNMVDRGLTTDILPQLQDELLQADKNLQAMKEIRENNVKRMLQKK